MRRLVAIAPPGRQVHGSSLLVTGGREHVAWFSGSHEGAPDTRIHVSLAARGESFGDPTVVTGMDGVAHWNPVLAAGPDGRIWLFLRVGERIDTWRTMVTTSTDGRSWETPRDLVPGDLSGGRGPVRQAPLQWRGAWWAGGSTECWDPLRWDCFVDRSRDGGRTWERIDLPLDHAACAGAGCIQPWLVEVEDRLVALTRSSGGAVFRAESPDGVRWGALQPTGLANNNSGIAVTALDDGSLVCVHNPGGHDWGPRDRLVLSVSGDGGWTWREAAVLEDGMPLPGIAVDVRGDGVPTAAGVQGVVTDGRGEFSYPSIARDGSRLIISYTWQRQAIVVTDMDIGALT
ncbi:sialidase family protein [Arachnia propionica]|uniref:Neuraminidase (Sialidase) n=1 Tax=Arachnia propionica TaxID=1750 RepID=A0A3P1WWL7_9ACTN|nr:sialidase family protein [Arachnia propionica]RRD51002.1 neuraminidase (sialidase) [Arachnia propionica]